MKTNMTIDLSETIEMGILCYSDDRNNFFSYQIFQQSLSDAMEIVANGFRSGAPKFQWFKKYNAAQVNF